MAVKKVLELEAYTGILGYWNRGPRFEDTRTELEL